MTKKNSWLPTEKNIEDYALLKEMLRAQRQEFDLLSKKKSRWSAKQNENKNGK